MQRIASKIAFSVILAGFFIITVFTALFYNKLDASFFIVFALVVIYIFSSGFAVGSKVQGEFDKLEKDLSKMAIELEEQKFAAQNAERVVDIKVRARTEALEETITALEQKIKNRTLELENIMRNKEK